VFSINGGELVVLLLVALVVLGPERLPQYAAQLAGLVRQARGFALRAREQVRSEMGPEFDDVDWQVLDPRRYDPRRIVREALLEGDDDPFGFDALRSLEDFDFDLPDSARSDSARSDSARSDSARSDSARSDSARSDSASRPRAEDEPGRADGDEGAVARRGGYDPDAT
jgi:sec-independent protein translocase protein TatB